MLVDIEVRPGGIWSLTPLDMAKVVAMVIFLIGNSVLKKYIYCLHFQTKHTSHAKPHSVCCDVTGKSIYFWLHTELWNGSKITPTRVFECQETISNKYYSFEIFFLHFFHHFRKVVAKLTGHTLYLLIFWKKLEE